MKKVVQLHPRRVFTSGAAGAWLIIYLPESTFGMIGGATAALIECTTYAVSGATARLKAQVWQGAKADVRPSAMNGGMQIGNDMSIATTGVTNLSLSPPFHGRIEVLVGTASTDSAVTTVEAEVNVTLIFE